ncbi:MAG: glycosyltransferase, partial [Rubrobacter sp.]
MRVLLTTHQFFPKHGSGTEVLARDTGLEMIARGHEVHVLTVDPGLKPDPGEVNHEDYDYQGLKVRALGLPTMPEAIDRIRYEYDNAAVARHVRRYVEEVAPDAVHVFHAARLSASILGVFEEAGLPVVYTPTDFWAICVRNTLMKPSGELSEGPDDISSNCLECREVERLLPATHILRKSMKRSKEDFYRETAERALAWRKGEHPSMTLVRGMLDRTRFLRERFNSVDAILAPTKLMRRMLTTNGIDPGLVTLSPYGMNVSRFRGVEPPRNGSGRLRVGYIGTIHPQKGVHVLIEAFKSLPRDAEATLRLCGSLAHFPEYSREVYELARPDPRINFAGTFPNEKIAEELGKIDVLVVPSTWYENTPLVIYSAFAAKIPVVATNLGGMAEVVHHGENGLLFEPGDARDLARQLGRLLREPDSLKRYAGNVGDVRSVEDSVDEMLDLYEGLLQYKRSQDHERARSASKSTEDWLWLNYLGIDKNPELKQYAAPFPPEGLRRLPTGGADELDFAAYGVQACRVLFGASSVAWDRRPVVLDHGCGCGPVARLLGALGVDLYAVDPDRANVDWIRSNLPGVQAVVLGGDERLPYVDESFDAAYSGTAFTSGGRERHEAQLADLARVTKPGAPVFLAVNGERALERAMREAGIRSAFGLDERLLEEAAGRFEAGEYATAGEGVAFVPGSYVHENWTAWFDLVGIEEGAVLGLQDIVVLRTKTEKPGLR